MKKYIIRLWCILLSGWLLSGCNQWLDLRPENEQAMGNFWNNKEEVDAVVMGAYVQLRNCVEDMILWGELRADMMVLGGKTDYDQHADYSMIRQLEIRPENVVAKWNRFYNVIGRCNAVIKFAPTVVAKDDSFEQSVCDSYLAEVVWLRSLAYFYLIRTFKDVPLVTEPYMSDEVDFKMPKSTEQVVLDTIVKNLNTYIGYIKPGYEVEWENKGRVTRYAYYALLADIYLWQGKYDAALDMIRKFEAPGLFYLLDNADWYKLYFPGNSDESIFEMQWNKELGQENNLYAWFFNEDKKDSKYAIADKAKQKFSEYSGEVDVRGKNGSFLDNGKIWKYAGTSANGTSKRNNDQKDANWIVYRYADIVLMKAEALVMKGGENNFSQAWELVKSVRERAGYALHPDEPADEYSGLMMVMDERAREFAFEGKRWYDLVRMAVRDNGKYKDILVQSLLSTVLAKDRPLWEQKLQNPYSYYLPIHQNDIDNSDGLLVQNPYYEGL